MKKVLIAVAALAALPATPLKRKTPASARRVHRLSKAALNWMFNTSSTSTFNFAGPSGSAPSPATRTRLQHRMGCRWRARLRLHRPSRRGRRRLSREHGHAGVGGLSAGISSDESRSWRMSCYDFLAGSRSSPISARGAGVAFLNAGDSRPDCRARQFAYQGILGVGWNIRPRLAFQPGRPLLRHDDSQLNDQGSLGGTAYSLNYSPQNNNISAHAEPPDQVRLRLAAAAAAAAADGGAAVVHGVLRLGPLEPEPAGAGHDQAGGRRLQDQGQCPHHGDRPHRHVGPGSLQHGAVAASRQRGEGRPGA